MNLTKPADAATPASLPRAFASGVIIFVVLTALTAVLGANGVLGFFAGVVGAGTVIWRKLSPPKVAVTWADCVVPSTTTIITPSYTDTHDKSMLIDIEGVYRSSTDAGYAGIFADREGTGYTKSQTDPSYIGSFGNHYNH